MSETLEELEEKYFMLEMQDTWSTVKTINMLMN